MAQKSGMSRPVSKGSKKSGQVPTIPQGNRYLAPKNPWGKGPNYGAND
jgi:hypothetical protein